MSHHLIKDKSSSPMKTMCQVAVFILAAFIQGCLVPSLVDISFVVEKKNTSKRRHFFVRISPLLFIGVIPSQRPHRAA